MSEGQVDQIHVTQADVGKPYEDNGLNDVGGTYTQEQVGMIKELDTAHDLANIIHTSQVAAENVVATREAELATGLTEKQRLNIMAINKVLKKYPNAFIEKDGSSTLYGSNGEPYLVSKPCEGQPTLVINQNGAIETWEYEDNSSEIQLVPASLDEKEISSINFLSRNSKEYAVKRLKRGNGRLFLKFSYYQPKENPGRIKELLTKTQEQYANQAPEPPVTSFLDEL